ncbi:MAG: M23 family metallopeptidase, partial [Chitinophagia bacterium]|nr:M23 family metallopeptidase [Chitinophagia bacterium]
GTIVFSPADGVVVQTVTQCRLGDVDCGGKYGNHVIIRHSNGIYSLMAHLYAVTAKKGDLVKQGQTIGSVGSTGRSSGPHLHFEFRMGQMGNYVPPSSLGVTYAGIGGSKKPGMKY